MAKPWYRDGLRFQCTRCGNCCTGAPGYVWVNDKELADIAAFLGQPVEEVEAMYAWFPTKSRTLREKPNGDCIFFERERGCTIYSVRPGQCRTWPFWESHLEDPDAWQKLREGCPGAGQGELISVEEITRRMRVIRL